MRLIALALGAALCACAPTASAPPEAQAPSAAAPATPAPASTAGLQHAPRSVEDAKAAGVDFRAVGQEPGWILDIGRELDLVYDYGEKRVTLPAGAPSYPQEGSTRYAAAGGGHAMTVTIQRFRCEDAMSGRPYPARVTVVVDGRTLSGCGGSL